DALRREKRDAERRATLHGKIQPGNVPARPARFLSEDTMTRRRAIPVLILGASCLLACPGSADAWGLYRIHHHHRAYGYPIMGAPGYGYSYGYSYGVDPYGLSPLDWARVGFDLLERLQQFRGGGGFRPPGMDPRIAEIDASKVKVSPAVVQRIDSLTTR